MTFKAKVDLIYILNCPKLQEIFENTTGNSAKKKYLSVYYGICLLGILPTRSKGFESKTKGDDNLLK